MAQLALLAGTAASVAGSVYKGKAAKEEGRAAQGIAAYNADVSRQEGEFTARQLERAAGEERVAGQRAAMERRGDLARVVSSQRALAAASGAGGVETPGMLDIFKDTIERGEYLAQGEMYIGESRARGRLDQAASARAGGENKAQLSLMEGRVAKQRGENAYYGSILEGIGTGARGFYEYDKAYGRSTLPRVEYIDSERDNPWRTRVRYG